MKKREAEEYCEEENEVVEKESKSPAKRTRSAFKQMKAESVMNGSEQEQSARKINGS